MFKNILTIVMATLCLNFNTKAQENKAVDVTSKGIQIGQMVPDITITNLHNYKDKNGKPAITAKLSDFKGKLLILDFWATWCSPCVAMIPKMDSLQKQFGDKIQFLSVTYQTEKEVLLFLEKYEKQKGKHYDLPVVTDSKVLHKLFPHVYLPHYVWIDGDGIVKAITELREVTKTNIEKMLQGTVLTQKRDKFLPYDFKETFHFNLKSSNWKAVYSSTLTHYIEGLTGGSSVRTDSLIGKKITLINTPILWLYELAFRDKGFLSRNRIRIETADSNRITTTLKGAAFRQWLSDGNGFCYELQVPPRYVKSIYEKMREELAYLFPKYEARMEEKEVEVYALKRTSAVDKIVSKGGEYEGSVAGNGCKLQNAFLIELIHKLNIIYQQKSPFPVVDKTGYTQKVDIDISANLSDMYAINKEIAKYDLEFVKSKELIEILVIRDVKRN